MHPDIERLLQLQVIDYDLGELERSKEYLPDMMTNLTREIEETKQKFEEAKKELEEARVRQQNLELDLKSKETSLQKYQQQMMSIKTNKEYDALVAEIDVIKETISNEENELLEIIDKIQALESGIEELEKKVAEVEENNGKQLNILQEKIDSIGGTVAEKKTERDKISKEIPRPTMSTYERVRRGRGGQSVVAIKNGACGACFKALTPKKIQEVKRNDRVYTCDHCGYLIFWSEDD